MHSFNMKTFARMISWTGHPLVFVSASIGVVVGTQFNLQNGVPILLALLLTTLVPTAVVLVAGVRSGRWSDSDVSVRKERQRFFPWALPFSLAGAIVLRLIHAPDYIVGGALVTLALFLAAWIVNFWLKLSLHALFAFYCATILFQIGVLWGATALVVAILVAWARLFLRRHTPVELIAGIMLGLVGGFVATWSG
jgi:membrane-associated phospholipid phosphatase